MVSVRDKAALGSRFEDGVIVEDAIAPEVEDPALRTLLKSHCGGFPVYPQLTEKLLKPASPLDGKHTHPDKIVARTLAVGAGYAYSDAPTLRTIMDRMGLEKCRCRMIRASVDAMFIDTTAFLVQSEDGRVVILVYRGTPPTSLDCWFADASVAHSKVELPNVSGGALHSGFYLNTRSVRYKIMEGLARAAAGKPITGADDEDPSSETLHPMEALYITGHSFGGALAAIETLLAKKAPLCGEEQYIDRLQATYTYGQPMVANAKLATDCDKDDFLKQRLVRFINAYDPVPHVPPRDTDGYKHFGRMYRYRDDAWIRGDHTCWDRQMYGVGAMFSSVLTFVAQAFWPARILQQVLPGYNFGDHAPQEYIAALTEPGALTELGDRQPTPAGTLPVLTAPTVHDLVASLPRPRA